jgi:hypothetical protein
MPPYQYVIDSSALFDLRKNYRQNTFRSLWTNFNGMCDNLQIISTREVLREIKNGNDELVPWSEEKEHIFLEPCESEYLIVQEIVLNFPKPSELNSTKPWADPFVLACAKHYSLILIQHEKIKGNSPRIPFIAKSLNVKCISLPDFFEEEGWEF